MSGLCCYNIVFYWSNQPHMKKNKNMKKEIVGDNVVQLSSHFYIDRKYTCTKFNHVPTVTKSSTLSRIVYLNIT